MTQVHRLACTAEWQWLETRPDEPDGVLCTLQGAIDMVQMQLGRPDVERQRRLAWNESTGGAPELLSTSPAATQQLPEAVQTYAWQDHGQHVELHIPAHSYVQGKVRTAQSLDVVARCLLTGVHASEQGPYMCSTATTPCRCTLKSSTRQARLTSAVHSPCAAFLPVVRCC